MNTGVIFVLILLIVVIATLAANRPTSSSGKTTKLPVYEDSPFLPPQIDSSQIVHPSTSEAQKQERANE